MAGTRRSSGWIRVQGANPSLGLYTEDPAVRVPYHFGLGVNDSGRLSTSTRNGALVTFPDAYSFGEAIELRFAFDETGNSQRQGIFMDVRTNAANTSTVRGIEITAQSVGDISVGSLGGARFAAIPRGESGTITHSYGVAAECSLNDADWAGTITAQTGVYCKVSNDNGGTYTGLDLGAGALTGNIGVLVHNEYINGTVKMDAAFAVKATNITTDSFNAIIDSTGARTTVSDTDKVLLWKFLRSDGTAVFMRYDTSDNALAFATS